VIHTPLDSLLASTVYQLLKRLFIGLLCTVQYKHIVLQLNPWLLPATIFTYSLDAMAEHAAAVESTKKPGSFEAIFTCKSN
jgi:hypothetical protein